MFRRISTAIAFVVFVAAALGCLYCVAEASAQEQPKSALSEVQQLKAQVFILKAQLAQCSANLADRENKMAGAELTKEQQTLSAEFLAASKAPAGSTWDWQTMTPKLPAPAPAAPAGEKK